MNHLCSRAIALVALMSAGVHVHAQESAPQADGDEATGSARGVLRLGEPDAGLKVAVAPYAWLTSFSGDTTIRGIEFDITTSFVDILEESDRVFGLMGAVDFEYDRLVFQINGAWTTAEVSRSRGVLANGVLNGDIDLDSAWFEFFGGYRILENPVALNAASTRRLTVDVFAGGRVTIMDVDATVSGEVDITLPNGEPLVVGQTRELSESKEWFEPFVGARIGLELSENWSLGIRGDVGGFGVSGAEFAWQVSALVGYRWHMDGWSVAIFGGYRALGQDYSDGDFGWDAVTHGPTIGAQFVFSF